MHRHALRDDHPPRSHLDPNDHLFDWRAHDDIMAREISLDRLYGLGAYLGVGDALDVVEAPAIGPGRERCG